MNVGEEGKGQMRENHRRVKQHSRYTRAYKQIELPKPCHRQAVRNEAQAVMAVKHR